MFDYELPEGYRDAIYVDADIFLDWRDKIKVLFGYRLTLKHQVFTENKPGACHTNTIVTVWRLRKGRITFVTEAEPWVR